MPRPRSQPTALGGRRVRDDDALQPAAEGRRDRRLELGGDLEPRRRRPHDPREARVEQQLAPLAEALALVLEILQHALPRPGAGQALRRLALRLHGRPDRLLGLLPRLIRRLPRLEGGLHGVARHLLRRLGRLAALDQGLGLGPQRPRLGARSLRPRGQIGALPPGGLRLGLRPRQRPRLLGLGPAQPVQGRARLRQGAIRLGPGRLELRQGDPRPLLGLGRFEGRPGGVRLLGQLHQPPRDPRLLAPRVRELPRGLLGLLRHVGEALLQRPDGVLGLPQRVGRRPHALVGGLLGHSASGVSARRRRQRPLGVLGRRQPPLGVLLVARERGGLGLVVEDRLFQCDFAEFRRVLQVPLGLAGLPAQALELALHLADDVQEALAVGPRLFHLALGLAAARAVAGDAGGLLDQHPALVGLRADDAADLALLDDGIGPLAARPRTHPGPGHQLLHIREPAALLVDAVVGAARALEDALDGQLLDVMPAGRHLGAAVVLERQPHLADAHGAAALAAGEDDVLHGGAPQRARALLPHHPLDRVDDVRLAAAVRAHDGGDAVVEDEGRPVVERLEAVDVEALELHGDVRRGPRVIARQACSGQHEAEHEEAGHEGDGGGELSRDGPGRAAQRRDGGDRDERQGRQRELDDQQRHQAEREADPQADDRPASVEAEPHHGPGEQAREHHVPDAEHRAEAYARHGQAEDDVADGTLGARLDHLPGDPLRRRDAPDVRAEGHDDERPEVGGLLHLGSQARAEEEARRQKAGPPERRRGPRAERRGRRDDARAEADDQARGCPRASGRRRERADDDDRRQRAEEGAKPTTPATGVWGHRASSPAATPNRASQARGPRAAGGCAWRHGATMAGSWEPRSGPADRPGHDPPSRPSPLALGSR
ncbi:MAG: hypothetical protein R3F60_20115 [bacterium]